MGTARRANLAGQENGVMTGAEREQLAIVATKLDALMDSHKGLRDTVEKWEKCQTDDERAIAVLIEQYGTMKEKVKEWNIINSLGVVLSLILAAIIGIFRSK
jgi:hypothetical protein